MDISKPINLTADTAMLWTWAVEFLPRLAAALALVIGGYLFAAWAGRMVKRYLRQSRHVDVTLAPTAGAVIRYGIIVLIAIAALGQLGVQTTSLLAALGAAALAIGLALQGTLSNIAAGLMLLWLRPFRAGDYIETPAAAGTVEELNLFHTQLRTWDGIFKFVPNAQLWNVPLTNYARNPTRLILIGFRMAYDDDLPKARAALLEAAKAHAKVIASPAPEVVPLDFVDKSIVLQMRAWSTVADFWQTRWDLTEAGKQALESAGIRLPQ
jgi:small conductance mechanosensitive channel